MILDEKYLNNKEYDKNFCIHKKFGCCIIVEYLNLDTFKVQFPKFVLNSTISNQSIFTNFLIVNANDLILEM